MMNSTPGNASSDCLEEHTNILFQVILDVVICVIELPMNVRLLWVSCSALQLLNLNLAVFGIIQCVFHIVDIIMIHVLPHYLKMSRAATLIFYTLGVPQIMACMCMERYVAVVWPTRYLLLKTYRVREACCAAAWTGTLLLSTAGYLSKNVVLIYDITSLLFLISVAGMIFSSIKILCTLRRSGPGKDEMHPVKLKAFQTVGRILGIIALCYLPSAIMIKISAQNSSDRLRCYLLPWSVGLFNLANIFNPLMILCRYSECNVCFASGRHLRHDAS